MLLAAGLAEGSPNTHPGQGTANRRFFFESGFLELLYVHDELEAQSDLSAPTQLWHCTARDFLDTEVRVNHAASLWVAA